MADFPPKSESPPVEGVVDHFRKPSSVSGWVVCRGGDPRKIRVAIFRNGRQIGEGYPDSERDDVVAAMQVGSSEVAGFTIECVDAIADSDWLGDVLVVVAYPESGPECGLGRFEKLRTEALIRCLTAQSAIDAPAALVLIDWLIAEVKAGPEVTEHLRQASSSLAATTAILPDKAAAPQRVKASVAESELWMRFQSLGHDCTLGEIQRHFGAEPLGLFRFSGIRIESVIEAVETEFAGIGSPEYTSVVPNEHGEYFSYDTRYHMASHTFIFENEVHHSRLYPMQCQKIEYLARLLREDIEEGAKVFVIHNLPGHAPQEYVDRLYAQLKRRGAKRFLYLCPADDEYPAGTVRIDADGKFIGYVVGSKVDKTDEFFTSWRSVCEAVLREVDRQ